MNSRLQSLRQMMKSANMDVYYFNTSDYHLSEYVPEYFKTIRYFSGFTGSLATLLVDSKKAYIFVDGRYFGQADNECLKNDVDVVKLGTEGALNPVDFIARYYSDKVIGFDGKRTSIAFIRQLVEKNIVMKSADIYSCIIEERTPLSKDKIFELPICYCGVTRAQKIERIFKVLNGKCHVVNNLESIAYVMNLRSNDILDTPVFLSYLVFLHNQVYFFVNMERMESKLTQKLLEEGIIVRPYERYYELLAMIKDQTILLDENKVNYESYLTLNMHRNTFVNMRSIIEDMKAVKNEVEIENAKLAHVYDGVAMVKFLYWLKKQDKTKITEYDAAEKLNSLRLSGKAFELSFEPIVAYNANAAMMHYSPTKEKCTRLDNKGILLVDSGGQYFEGTTDITRTISLGKTDTEIKRHFTIVLKSMFNFSGVTFMSGMTGKMLDVLARKDIWEELIDYRCGTGHGVGQVLSVHENPPNVRYTNHNGSENVVIKPGNIFSCEPGIYLEGKYGIRCENLILCKEKATNEYGKFLNFETITYCPFDLDLIDIDELDEKTRKQLNAYHAMVYDKLRSYLTSEEDHFLLEATREI